MRKHLYILFLLLLSAQLALAQELARYEYWLDNQYDGRTTVNSNIVASPLSIDISKQKPGIHYFNFRALARNGQWGGLTRYMYYVPEAEKGNNGITQYEYWLDNKYDSRTTVNSNTVASPLSIDISMQKPGIHYFTFRALARNGQWGGMTRYMYYVPEAEEGNNGITQYEYWLDNQYNSRTTVKSNTVASPLSIDISKQKPGIHYFNFRALAKNGHWGELTRYMYYIADRLMAQKKLTTIDYWIDEDISNKGSLSYTGSTMVLTMDITDLPKGKHALVVQGKMEDGSVCMLDAVSFTTNPLPVVAIPTISREGNTITIESGESDNTEHPIELYYTLDGTTPTRHSTLYEGPFGVTQNGVVKAIARQYAHDDSEVAILDVDWFRVANPKFAQVGKKLTITTDTTRAAIYYKIGNGEEQLYQDSIRLADQSTVTAVARYEGYHDSETMTYQPRVVKSAKPVAAYNGRYLQLNSNDEGVSFHYTIDGSSPAQGLDVSGNAIEYRGQMTIDTLCTVRAVAIIDTMNVSDVLVFPIDYLYNDQTATAYLRKAGELEKAFEWCGGTNGVTQLRVEGTLSNKDVEVLKGMTALRHLDMQKVQLTSNQLVDDAFAGSPMVSYVSPAALTKAGGRLFADCPNLAAVVWNANVSLGSNTFAGVSNPNLLLYMNSASLNQTTATNVVVNGTAEKITLGDASTGNGNFYCPQAFTAQDISYTHDYQQETARGVTQGWETLTLPFTVQSVRHVTHGALTPFTADGDGYPFWLMALQDDGLKLAQTIEAYKPYVISMPNNPGVYADEYNQKGRVTFAAKQAVVDVSNAQPVSDSRGNTLIPAFQTVARSGTVYVLNVGDGRDGMPPGSTFLSDYRDARPFEVYMPKSPLTASKAVGLRDLMGNEPTGIVDIMTTDGPADHVRAYNLSGFLINSGKREEVLKQLPKGIYILNGRKMVVK